MKLLKSTIPKGYSRTIERTNDVKSFDPKSLQLHLEPEQKDGYIKGEVLAERMKDKGFSANVLDYLLAHPKLIPEDWKGKWVYFWGTTYRSAYGYLYVRSLFWHGGRWVWDYRWLSYDWNDSYPAAVSASPLDLYIKPSSDTLSLELRLKKLEEWAEKEANFINPFPKI